MPIAGMFMPFEQALGLTAIFHAFSNAAKMYLFRGGFDKRLLVWLGIPAIVGVMLRALLTRYMNEHWLMIALGVMLTAMSATLLLRPLLRLQASNRNAAVGGAISGFIAGVAGTGGAIRGITLAAFDLEKNVFVSTSAWIDMGGGPQPLGHLHGAGLCRGPHHHLPAAMAVDSIAGSWVGKQLLGRIPQKGFRTAVLVLVLVVGLVTLYRGLM